MIQRPPALAAARRSAEAALARASSFRRVVGDPLDRAESAAPHRPPWGRRPPHSRWGVEGVVRDSKRPAVAAAWTCAPSPAAARRRRPPQQAGVARRIASRSMPGPRQGEAGSGRRRRAVGAAARADGDSERGRVDPRSMPAAGRSWRRRHSGGPASGGDDADRQHTSSEPSTAPRPNSRSGAGRHGQQAPEPPGGWSGAAGDGPARRPTARRRRTSPPGPTWRRPRSLRRHQQVHTTARHSASRRGAGPAGSSWVGDHENRNQDLGGVTPPAKVLAHTGCTAQVTVMQDRGGEQPMPA